MKHLLLVLGLSGLIAAGWSCALGAEPEERSAPLRFSGVKDLQITGKTFGGDAPPGPEASVILENCTNVEISGCRFIKTSGIGILVKGGQDIRIQNNWFSETGAGTPRTAVVCNGVKDVIIRGNLIDTAESGAYIVQSSGVWFVENCVRDVQGPYPRGQMVQFDKVTGRGNLIAGNLAVNQWRRSRPQDVINIFKCTGTPESPITVRGNWVAGDLAMGSQDTSTSGSGIMLGDGGGEHILCTENVLLSPGQVGIGVASGKNIEVRANIILGRRSNVSNVGIYVWSQYQQPTGTVRIVGNTVAWANAKGGNSSFWRGPSKFGAEFEFPEVVAEANAWDAWAQLRSSFPLPPTVPLLPPPPPPAAAPTPPAPAPKTP